jgi:hypothetical protein
MEIPKGMEANEKEYLFSKKNVRAGPERKRILQ